MKKRTDMNVARITDPVTKLQFGDKSDYHIKSSLMRAGIVGINQLCEKTESDLLEVKGIERNDLVLIRLALSDCISPLSLAVEDNELERGMRR